MSEEVRTTNEKTGGQKGTKIERYDLVPAEPLRQWAELYGKGASKYADRNWELGYDWSLSFAALNRHLWAFWAGENQIPQTPEGVDDDPTAGTNHLVAVMWHAAAMLEWMDTHPELDNRPNRVPQELTIKPDSKVENSLHYHEMKVVNAIRRGQPGLEREPESSLSRTEFLHARDQGLVCKKKRKKNKKKDKKAQDSLTSFLSPEEVLANGESNA